MAAIFPIFFSITEELLSAALACDFIDRFSIHPIRMRVPPFHSTLVTTETFHFPSWNLFNWFATLFAFVSYVVTATVGLIAT